MSSSIDRKSPKKAMKVITDIAPQNKNEKEEILGNREKKSRKKSDMIIETMYIS